jgi:hypothetical protein
MGERGVWAGVHVPMRAQLAPEPAGAGRAWEHGPMRRRRPPASWMASCLSRLGPAAESSHRRAGHGWTQPTNAVHASCLPPMPAGIASQKLHWLLRAHAARARAWRQRGCPARQDRHGAARLQHPRVPLLHRPDHRRRGGHRLARLHAALWLSVVAGAAAAPLPLYVEVARWPGACLERAAQERWDLGASAAK